MNYDLIINNTEKQIHPLGDAFTGESPSGEKISFTNYYMQRNDQPFFGVSGEFHFSRSNEIYWEDELIKMKMGGINVVATYVIWIHHEECEGEFDFTGRRDIRKFIELCQKHGLYVIIRIGPFDHGEVRNGGLPDWLYGKPFEVRTLDEGFVAYTRRWYTEIGKQIRGLFYKDGGPIIATQIDNEYQHSSAPWEITTGITDEWVYGGHEGNEYMVSMKRLAQDCGIVSPFYTCTAWGGAPTPIDEMMPLWGGYAYWPWIFYSYQGEHPVTPEYIYRDLHNNEIPSTYNFEPYYKPEEMPYACCEMGGGMSSFYNYRFQLDYASVDAMANIKIASGCNFLGYYVYKGGTNPLGKKTPFLSECQCPKLSYDYQAAIGEYGQLRDSYRRLKPLHMLTEAFGKQLCKMKTILPEGAEGIDPKDTDTLRFSGRFSGTSGFLFLNNYQDHLTQKGTGVNTVNLCWNSEKLAVENISLAADENCILPVHFNAAGYHLDYATVQPITVIKDNGETCFFFLIPDGMQPAYHFADPDLNIISESDVTVKKENGRTVVYPSQDQITRFCIEGETKVHIISLPRRDANHIYKVDDTILLCEDAILVDGETIRVETQDPQGLISIYGSSKSLHSDHWEPAGIISGFRQYRYYNVRPERLPVTYRQVGPTRFVLELPQDIFAGQKQALLSIDYKGDIGQAFVNGTMISDNFCNGATWEIGLKEHEAELSEHPVTLYIIPLKEGVNVNVESTMAARNEQVKNAICELYSVTLDRVAEIQGEIRITR